ncbi:MAG: sensor histidine kinase [Pseudomonadota bacterium]
MKTLDGIDVYAALIHELKNNLGLLAMTLEAIPDTGGADHDGRLDDARLLCQRVIDRLQQALFVYKAERQAVHPMVDAYSPADMAAELCETAAALSRGRLSVDLEMADDAPALWFFDRNLVEMALLNAIHNSLDYARQSLRIRVGMSGPLLEITVEDDSPGFPEHVLESFAAKQAYRSTSTGLGLQFAQMIAEAHENKGVRGELRLANEDGARFSLRLP